jgi:hypothetical protein
VLPSSSNAPFTFNGFDRKGLNCFQTDWKEGPDEENLLTRKRNVEKKAPCISGKKKFPSGG